MDRRRVLDRQNAGYGTVLMPKLMAAHDARHSDQVRYYARFLAQPDDVPFTLQAANAAVIGLGGIGSEVIRHLAAAGIGHLYCIDHDVVELPNLNRQFWYLCSDVGRSKAEVMSQRVVQFAGDLRVTPAQTYIRTENDLLSVLRDEEQVPKQLLIACCADTPIGTVERASLAVGERFGCAVGVCAMGVRRGYWGVFTTPAARHAAMEFFARAERLASNRCGSIVTGSASWTNSVIGAFFGESLVATLTGLPHARVNCLCAFDFDSMAASVTADFSDGLVQ